MLHRIVYEDDTNAPGIRKSEAMLTQEAKIHGIQWLTVQILLLFVSIPARFHKKDVMQKWN